MSMLRESPQVCEVLSDSIRSYYLSLTTIPFDHEEVWPVKTSELKDASFGPSNGHVRRVPLDNFQ